MKLFYIQYCICSSFNTADLKHSEQHCNVQTIQCNGKLSVYMAVLYQCFTYISASKQHQNSFNPQILNLPLLQICNITSPIGSLDQVETDSMKGENKNTSVCKIFTLATKYHQILYITVNISSSHLNIVFQASDFTSHDNSNSFSNHSNKSQNTFCVKHEHNQPIYKSSACCFL